MAVDRSALPAVGPDPIFVFPEIAHHRLANGLRVRTVEHRSVPVVTFTVQVDGGSGADPAGQEGLAAIAADMADEGTGPLSAIDVSDALDRIGAEYEVEVAPDATSFGLTTLRRFATRGANLLADLVIRPSLHQADFDRVRQLRLDRLRQLKDVPTAVADRFFMRRLYGPHPYGHLSIGSEASLSGLGLADVVAFHAQRCRPSTSMVVAAGDLSHQELLAVAERAFGGWVEPATPLAGDVPASERVPAATTRGLAIVPREGAAQSELRIGHLSARRDTPDYSPLLVMNAVLGGQFVSRINLKLREEKAFTYGARTGFDWRRGLAPFALHTSVHTASTAEAVSDALAEIDGIRGRRPVTADELALAKASLTRGYPRAFETVQQVARSVAQLALYGLPDTYFAAFVPQVNAVSAADVTRVAADYLDPAKLHVVAVGDRAQIEAPLRALGIGEPEILPFEN
jgi:predicted Zn-dependent peptidase